MIRQIDVDLELAQDISADLLTGMQNMQVDVPTGIAASALTFGRLLAGPGAMNPEQEAEFMKEAVMWGSLYFTPTKGVH